MKFSISEALFSGIKAQQSGRLREADRLYTEILKIQPKHPDANHNMGVLAVNIGKAQEALPFFENALNADPTVVQYWRSYIVALIHLKQIKKAKKALLLAQAEGFRDTDFNDLEQQLSGFNQSEEKNSASVSIDAALELKNRGKVGDAIQLLEGSLGQFPEDINLLALLTHCHLLNNDLENASGVHAIAKKLHSNTAEVSWNEVRLLLAKGEVDKAMSIAINTHKHFPNDAEGLIVLAHSLRTKGHLTASVTHLTAAIQISPNLYQAYIDRAITQLALNDKKNALADFEKANYIRPDIKKIWDFILKLKIELKDFSGALTFLKSLLEIEPAYEKKYEYLGYCNHKLGKFKEAVAAYDKLLSIRPNDADAHNAHGISLRALGKITEAIHSHNKAIKLKPDNEDAFFNLGIVFSAQGNFKKAIKNYNKVIAINPNHERTHNNLGNILRSQGHLNKALESYNKAIKINPKFLEATCNLGIIYKSQEKFEEAIKAFEKAITIDPTSTRAYIEIGIILNSNGSSMRAVKLFKEALAINPNCLPALLNLGNAYKKLGELTQAMEAYEEALTIDNTDIETWCQGADALEKSNKLSELEHWIERASTAFEKLPPDVTFMKAKCLYRTDDYHHAFSVISQLDVSEISQNKRRDFLNLKGKCCEKLEKYDVSYHSFLKSNTLAKQSKAYEKANPDRYFEHLKIRLNKINKGPIALKSVGNVDNIGFTPTFLVGFPRSGTTLLDTILRTHSKIEVIEEKPILENVNKFFVSTGCTDVIHNKPSIDIIAQGRKLYEDQFLEYVDKDKFVSSYIDKYPLNLLAVPLIIQLYPEARFILALRHPMDVVISCWAQDFEINPAMANMLDLRRTVDFYCLAMEFFKKCRELYCLNVHEIKYENLIGNLRVEATNLLDFLNLNWEENLINFQNTALERGKIHTPSYSQVVKPLYTDSQLRWKRYEMYLRKYQTKMQPWIDEFNYK